jgi:hypothetical protein
MYVGCRGLQTAYAAAALRGYVNVTLHLDTGKPYSISPKLGWHFFASLVIWRP